MKHWISFLSVYAALCFLFGGCTERLPAKGPDETNPTLTQLDRPQEGQTLTLRVIDGAEEGQLLLAGTQEDSSLYTISIDPAVQDVQNGQLVSVRSDIILETYPAQFDPDATLEVLEDGFDDRCALYLQVLEDLWEKDAALNSDVTFISVDLAGTSLSPAERSGVAWAFASAHQATALELDLEGLLEEGYLTTVEPEDPSHSAPYVSHWEDGILFSIEELEEDPSFSLGEKAPDVLNTVVFTAQKWRSSLGAYGFSRCTAVQSNSGAWGAYQIQGGEFIS